MDIHPIKTEVDYQAALADIERLFDAAPNTPAGDRLDVLTTLKNSDVPVAPGEEVVEHPEARPMLPPAAAE